jgi:RimJ/RimL family protein N-acetyltransferase
VPLRIRLPSCELRPWQPADASSLQRHADNPRVAGMLTDRFPHPYTAEHADAWIALNQRREPPTNFAIVVDGAAVGGIGIELRNDVNRRSAEIGYWLGEPYWGRGIATDAVRAMTQYALATFDVCRLAAHVFDGNVASARVLEKAGYLLEGRLRRSIYKGGRMLDERLFAFVVER